MKIFFILTIIGLFSLNFTMSINTIATITDDENSDTTFFLLRENSLHISEFCKEVYDHSDVLIEHECYPVFDGTLNIVLKRERNLDVVILKSDHFSTYHGGSGQLNYVYNGLRGVRKDFPIQLYKIDNKWRMLDSRNREIVHLHFKSNRQVPFGTIGIKEIIPYYDYFRPHNL